MVTSRATYWKGSFLCGCRNNKPTSAGRMLRECWGARPGGSMWTSRWSSTIPACGAKCWSTSKTASRMVLDRAVLWAAAHEKKWSPSGSNLGAAGHVHSFTYSKSGLFSTNQPLHHTHKESHTQRERTQCTNYATNPCLTLSTVPLPHTSGFRSDQRHSKHANVAKTHHVLPKVPLFIRVIIIIITTNLHTYPRLTECLLLPHTSGL